MYNYKKFQSPFTLRKSNFLNLFSFSLDFVGLKILPATKVFRWMPMKGEQFCIVRTTDLKFGYLLRIQWIHFNLKKTKRKKLITHFHSTVQ